MTLPQINVYVSFTNPYATPSWVDISRYAESFKTTSGRQHELQQVQPSTASIVLSNEGLPGDPGGRFSPWNTAGKYYGSGQNLVPMRPVKITSTISGTTYPVFYGYVDNWTPSYGVSRSTVTLNASSIEKALNLDTLDTGALNNQILSRGAIALWTMGDTQGSTFADASGNSYTATLIGSATFGVNGAFLTESSTAVSFARTATTATATGCMKTPITSSSATGGYATVEGWFQPVATGVDQIWFNFPAAYTSGTGGSLKSLTVGVRASDNHIVVVECGNIPTPSASGNTVLIDTGIVITAGTWYDVGCYVPSGSSAGSFTIDVNGTGPSPTSMSSTYNFGVSSTLPFIAGGGWWFWGDAASPYSAFPGVMDQVSFTPGLVNFADNYQLGSATWQVQDSGSRIKAVLDVVGVPSSLYNIGTGSSTLQAATSSLATTSAMSYINTCMNTEEGLVYQDASGVVQFRNRHYIYTNSTSTTSQATFGYSTAGGILHYLPGLVPALDDLDLWNNVTVARTGGVPQNAQNTTSQTAYGRRTLTGKTGLLYNSDLESLAAAQQLMAWYSTPQTRVRSITVDNLTANGANLIQMLSRQLLDRITVVWKPLDGSTVDFNQSSFIEAINHDVDAATQTWKTTWAITPIAANQGAFILGTTALSSADSTDHLAF